MGWAGGSELADKVWHNVRTYIPKAEDRKRLAKKIIDLFEDEDCDTMDECETLQQDAKYKSQKKT